MHTKKHPFYQLLFFLHLFVFAFPLQAQDQEGRPVSCRFLSFMSGGEPTAEIISPDGKIIECPLSSSGPSEKVTCYAIKGKIKFLNPEDQSYVSRHFRVPRRQGMDHGQRECPALSSQHALPHFRLCRSPHRAPSHQIIPRPFASFRVKVIGSEPFDERREAGHESMKNGGKRRRGVVAPSLMTPGACSLLASFLLL